MTERFYVNKNHYFSLLKDSILLCKIIQAHSDILTSGECNKADSIMRKIEIVCAMYSRSGLPEERKDWKDIRDLIK